MNSATFFKCACQQCGGRIEYPADAIGTSVECPHCGASTELRLEAGATDDGPPRKKTWLIAGLISLLVLFALGISAPVLVRNYLRQHTRNVSANPSTPARPSLPAAAPEAINGFLVENVAITRSGGSIAHATGTLRNQSDKQRFGVRVELDLFDANGTKVGTASDYAGIVEPRAEWLFRALVIQPGAATARVSTIRDEP